MSKVWLITGCGSGLGREIAEAALRAGQRLIATARNPEMLEALKATYGDQVRTVALDVTDERAAEAAVQLAVDAFGRLDVLVNNAGYGHIAPFEQISPRDFKAVVDTSFYGVVFTTRAAVPIMRKQKSGWIVQISSIGGRLTVPGNSPYHAAKWAVGGFSDSVAAEVSPFGVKMVTLEPGGIRTNWNPRARQNMPELMPEYQASVGPIYQWLKDGAGHEESDPRKIANVILTLVKGDKVPRRLILGATAAAYLKQWDLSRLAETEAWQSLTESTTADDATPMFRVHLD
ncbi:SDR family NAD(P)-dependent oxidoreductase [Terriglobus roseus]|uniref:NADP-dependent 3-hydroxy acid dehydrogenase YdfG n=1 Tax=Terriglobus roseus TaxID=392734 RepID=A0A1H4K9F4_9BACT|nr:SDR family NAD(P)-dependent oxidoreductase [Terriglobus roseus]SEB54926.1 NADP-dependent 3-hydroxy acid dehydrogenase YdfG [Terriglobus roseus]